MSIPSAMPRLALVALLAAAPTASGAQWVKVGGSSRLDLYIDRASITREGARLQALVRTEWA